MELSIPRTHIRFKEEFENDSTLTNWLKYFSAATWDRIGYVRNRKDMKIYETTITQNFLYDFRLLAESKNLNIDFLEAQNEKANGNDLEVILELNDGCVLLPMQAKLLYKGAKYGAIDHENKGGPQILSLIAYANEIKGIPLYLLYNYYNGSEAEQRIGIDPQTWGCSIVNALYIRDEFSPFSITDSIHKWKIPSFLRINPFPAIQLFKLAEMVEKGYNFKQFCEESRLAPSNRQGLLIQNCNDIPDSKEVVEKLFGNAFKSKFINSILPLDSSPEYGFNPSTRIRFKKS